MGKKPTIWQYGVTTVPSRLGVHLPDTLRSLAAAGFDAPILFVDGFDGTEAYDALGCQVVYRRKPAIGAFGNWVLALWELYLRRRDATWFVIFQDDIRACAGLRDYLTHCSYPDKNAYYNLITYPQNEQLVPDGLQHGWFKSNQNGLGAQGLMFSAEAVSTILSQDRLTRRPREAARWMAGIDGVACRAMRDGAKWTEYVHWPSLLDHVGVDGDTSIPRQQKMPHRKQPKITCYTGNPAACP